MHPDVIVIGGGLHSAAAALHLARCAGASAPRAR
jgi:glycine/D-amino acid oxidase-like deaminating enzyme